MPSQKPRVATYTDEITIRKFKIIAAYNNKSMSEYLQEIISNNIAAYEHQHGPIVLPTAPQETDSTNDRA